MGTKVQSKSYLPGYHSMRDLNEDANSFNWPVYYGDKTISTGKYCNGFLPRVADVCPGYDKDVVKRTMLEHEAVFKNQVYELHRVYRIQRDLMEEIKRKELRQSRIPSETSLSSIPLALSNSNSARPSVSGAEDAHSPFSHLKGNSAQNWSISKSKDTDVVQPRPSKVRRKMFDLHLPADEYIDTEEEEHFRKEKASEISTYLHNRNQNIAPDDSRSDLSLRSSTGLADLNEPAQVEEINPPEYVDLVRTSCHREVGGHEMLAKANSQFLGTTKEVSMNSDIGSSNGTFTNLYLENGNGRIRHPHVPETGQSKNILNSASQGFPNEKLSQSLLNKGNESSNFQTDQSKIDWYREKMNSMYPASPSPDLVKPWSQLVSSWDKPNSTLNKKSMLVQSHPALNLSSTFSKSANSPSQSHGVFGEMRYVTSNSRRNSGFGKEFPNQNGGFHSSSSVSKELQVPDLFASHGSSKYGNGLNSVGSVKGVDLNEVLATSSPNAAVSQHGVGFVNGARNHKDHFAGLPWLRSESANLGRDFSNWQLSFFRSATDQLSRKSDAGKSCDQLFPQNVQSGVKIIDGSNHAKILGFPIFETPCTSEKENGFETMETNKKSRLFDMNLPCDAADPDLSQQTVEKRTDEKNSVFRRLIDLNSCLSEDDAPFTPFVPRNKLKSITQIDLDVPAAPEPETEENPKQTPKQDEIVEMAAKAIVDISISSFSNIPPGSSMPDPLNWFVEIACENDIESKLDGKDSNSEPEEVDYFESMTLQLTETEPEHYTPTPLFLAEEQEGNAVTTRPRRGQARRGRQRRDFQRDILPGLTTLARHEVTEDIQTLGSMMRATGHSWQLARRSSGRGRRRAVLASPPRVVVPAVSDCKTRQVNNIGIGVEEMSLTGWGKTTRRPRRQRWPAAGIHQSLPLSKLLISD